MSKFGLILAAVKSKLGIDKLAKDENGVSILTDDQKNTLKEEYGEKFLETFLNDLSKEENQAMANDVKTIEQLKTRLSDLQAEYDAFKVTSATQIENLQGMVDTLSASPEGDDTPPNKGANGKKATAMKINKNLSHNKLATEYLSGNTAVLAAGETIDVNSVIEEFEDLVNYVKLPVIKDIMTGFETAKHMTHKRAINSYKATRASMTSVVQQFIAKWTPSGKATFTPLEIPLRRMKINAAILPADVENWIFQMYDEGVDIDKMPITLYIINNLIKPQALEDIELKIIANGKFVELDPSAVNDGDAGQDPEKSMDGFMTILRKQKADPKTKINFVDLGSIDDSNIVDKVNKFVDSIDEKLQHKEMPIHCSLTRYKQYKRAYKKLYGSDSGDPKFGSDVVDYSNNRLVPLPSMHGEGGFFCTPKQNFILLKHKNEAGASKLFIQKQDYTVKVFGEFRLGVGFEYAEAVVAYIPEESGESQSA